MDRVIVCVIWKNICCTFGNCSFCGQPTFSDTRLKLFGLFGIEYSQYPNPLFALRLEDLWYKIAIPRPDFLSSLDVLLRLSFVT